MSDNKESKQKKVKKVTKEIPKETLLPEVVDQDQYTPSELAKQRIKRHFHKQHPGQKKIPIDWVKFEEMARLGMRVRHIASRLGVSHDTLLRRCKEEFGMDSQHVIMGLSGDIRIALMQKMWKEALSGKNNLALLHMAKHMLDMHDKRVEIDENPEDEAPQTIEYSPKVMGFEGKVSGEDIRKMMADYLNKPSKLETAEDIEEPSDS